MDQVPIHPFLVHFPIGGWLIGTALLWIGVVKKKNDWLNASWACLGIAAVMTVPAVLAGQSAIADFQGTWPPELVRHQQIGTLIPFLMVGLLLIKVHTLFKKDAKKPPEWTLALLASIVAILVIYAGLLGGKLVYLLGVGSRG